MTAPPGLEPAWLASTVHLPADGPRGNEPVLVAFAGATYTRRYFDLDETESGSYSMARYFTERGCVFVAVDNLGTGDSAKPPGDSLSMQAMADAGADAVGRIVAEIVETAGLDRWVPTLIGIGHSMGACVVTVMQARHDVFDAVALLGWSSVHVAMPPAPPHVVDGDLAFANVPGTPEGYVHWLTRPPSLQWAFCLEDTEAAVLDCDPSSIFPACALVEMSQPGVVAAQAATIEVPILLALGERDVASDPRAEVACYRSSRDVTLFLLDGAGHCHNYARSRERLWARILAWLRPQLDSRGGRLDQ